MSGYLTQWIGIRHAYHPRMATSVCLCIKVYTTNKPYFSACANCYPLPHFDTYALSNLFMCATPRTELDECGGAINHRLLDRRDAQAQLLDRPAVVDLQLLGLILTRWDLKLWESLLQEV